jgi:hypothetical protein
MIVLLHVLIAVMSLMLVTYTFFKPTNKTLLTSYISIFATLTSGFTLVWIEPAKMLHTCEAGLIYFAIVATATTMARARLMKLKEGNSL